MMANSILPSRKGVPPGINKMNRLSRQHLQEFGFEPDASVLAEKMEISEEKIRKIMKIAKEPISMETPRFAQKPLRQPDAARRHGTAQAQTPEKQRQTAQLY